MKNKSIIEKIDNYFKDIKKQNREFLKVDVVEGEVVLDMESNRLTTSNKFSLNYLILLNF